MGEWGGGEKKEQQEAAWLPGYGVSAAVASVDLGELSSHQRYQVPEYLALLQCCCDLKTPRRMISDAQKQEGQGSW